MVVVGWSVVMIRKRGNRELTDSRERKIPEPWGVRLGTALRGSSKIESRDPKVGKVTVFAKQKMMENLQRQAHFQLRLVFPVGGGAGRGGYMTPPLKTSSALSGAGKLLPGSFVARNFAIAFCHCILL